jgi:hypothetical protein
VAVGQAQLQLPERIHPNTYGWEGEIRSYRSGSPRLFRPDAFIIDDTAFNCWASFDGEKSSVLAHLSHFVFPKNIFSGGTLYPPAMGNA